MASETLDNSSIIERPWTGEGWNDIRCGTKYCTRYEQSNQNDSSATIQGSNPNKSQTSEVAHAAENSSTEDKCRMCLSNGHHYLKCPLKSWVPMGATVGPLYMIICGYCGYEMKSDLKCPGCKCSDEPGRIMPNIDLYEDMMIALAKTVGDVCEDQNYLISSSP